MSAVRREQSVRSPRRPSPGGALDVRNPGLAKLLPKHKQTAIGFRQQGIGERASMGDNENLRSRRRTSNKPRQRGEQILMEARFGFRSRSSGSAGVATAAPKSRASSGACPSDSSAAFNERSRPRCACPPHRCHEPERLTSRCRDRLSLPFAWVAPLNRGRRAAPASMALTCRLKEPSTASRAGGNGSAPSGRPDEELRDNTPFVSRRSRRIALR